MCIIFSADNYIQEHLDEFIDRYVQDELSKDKFGNDIEFNNNVENFELPNEDYPLKQGKVAVKKVKFDVDVVDIPEGETISGLNILVDRVGENLVPDAYDPEDSLGKYVKVNNIKYTTGDDVIGSDEIIEEGKVGINEVGNNVTPIAFDPEGSEEAYIKMKNIKVATNNLYSKLEYDMRYGQGVSDGYNNCANEARIETLQNLNIKARDYLNKGNVTVFPNEEEYVGKKVVGLVNLDMSGIEGDESRMQPLNNYNVKDNCYENGQPKQNPFPIIPSTGYVGFKNVSLNLTGLYTDADGNEPNNASVQQVTGRDDNKIVENATFNFQNLLGDNYTGWNNFVVDVPTVNNLSISDLDNDINYSNIIEGNKIIGNGEFNINEINQQRETDYTGFDSFVVEVPSKIKNKNVNNNNLISGPGNYYLSSEDLRNGYTGWNNFSVDYSGYVERSLLREGNTFTIDASDYTNGTGDKDVDINIGTDRTYFGLLNPVKINTDGVISRTRLNNDDVFYDNSLVGIKVSDKDVFSYKNIWGNEVPNDNQYFSTNYSKDSIVSIVDENDKYFKNGKIKGRLLNVTIPTMSVINSSNNEEVWSPYNIDENGYVYFSNSDYENWLKYSTNLSNDPFTGFSNVRYRLVNVKLPDKYINESNQLVSIVGGSENKYYQLSYFNNSVDDSNKMNGFNAIEFKLKDLVIDNIFMESLTNNESGIFNLVLSQSEIDIGYRGFNNLVLKMIKRIKQKNEIKRVGNKIIDKKGKSVINKGNNKWNIKNFILTSDNNKENGRNDAGMQEAEDEVEIPVMDNVVNNIKYTSDGTYTFSIEDWNKLYGLSGSLNQYGNDFCAMESFTFTIETGSSPPPYSGNLYSGSLGNSLYAEYGIVNNVPRITLKRVAMPVRNRDGEVSYYDGFAPGCYLELPDIEIKNNVTYSETDYNSGTQVGTEVNEWSVTEEGGVVNDGSDEHLNCVVRSSRDVSGFTYPTLGGTITNKVNLLSNFTDTMTGASYTFNIGDFNSSNKNTFCKDFLGVRSFTINAPGSIVGETLNVTQNGQYIPESGHMYNEVNVNVQEYYVNNINNVNITNKLGYSISEYNNDNDTSYSGFGSVLPVLYDLYNINNRLSINSNGRNVLTVPSGYCGFNDIYYDVDVPSNVYNDPNNTRILSVSSGGSYSGTNFVQQFLPGENYTGFSSFTVNVPLENYIGDSDIELISSSPYVINIGSNDLTSGYIGFKSTSVVVKPKNKIVNNNGLITVNGVYNVPTGFSGFDSFEVSVTGSGSPVLENKVITYNGFWTPQIINHDVNVDGMNQVTFVNSGTSPTCYLYNQYYGQDSEYGYKISDRRNIFFQGTNTYTYGDLILYPNRDYIVKMFNYYRSNDSDNNGGILIVTRNDGLPFNVNRVTFIGGREYGSCHVIISYSNDGNVFTEVYNDEAGSSEVVFDFYNNINMYKYYKFECVRSYNYDSCPYRLRLYTCTDGSYSGPNILVEQTREVTYNQGGVYHITPSVGYTAINDVIVRIPMQLQQKQVTLYQWRDYGFTTFTPDPGYAGFSSFTVYLTNDPAYLLTQMKLYYKSYIPDNLTINQDISTGDISLYSFGSWIKYTVNNSHFTLSSGLGCVYFIYKYQHVDIYLICNMSDSSQVITNRISTYTVEHDHSFTDTVYVSTFPLSLITQSNALYGELCLSYNTASRILVRNLYNGDTGLKSCNVYLYDSWIDETGANITVVN